MLSADLLRQAADLVETDRDRQHGDKLGSFSAIGAMWDAYLAGRRNRNASIDAYDVANMLALMKLCRAEWGERLVDHHMDQIGYMAIAAQFRLGGIGSEVL